MVYTKEEVWDITCPDTNKEPEVEPMTVNATTRTSVFCMQLLPEVCYRISDGKETRELPDGVRDSVIGSMHLSMMQNSICLMPCSVGKEAHVDITVESPDGQPVICAFMDQTRGEQRFTLPAGVMMKLRYDRREGFRAVWREFETKQPAPAEMPREPDASEAEEISRLKSIIRSLAPEETERLDVLESSADRSICELTEAINTRREEIRRMQAEEQTLRSTAEQLMREHEQTLRLLRKATKLSESSTVREAAGDEQQLQLLLDRLHMTRDTLQEYSAADTTEAGRAEDFLAQAENILAGMIGTRQQEIDSRTRPE